MPFPQGGDFTRNVNRGINLVSSDPKRNQEDIPLLSSPTITINHFIFQLSGGVSNPYSVYQITKTIDYGLDLYKFDITKQGKDVLTQVEKNVASSFFVASVSPVVSSFWPMAQFNPGSLPHLPDAFSDLYILDVFSSVFTYNREALFFIETLAARLKQEGDFNSFKNLVQTDYYTTISGSDDICEGDEEPPFITYHSPSISGSVLRPRDQIVDFSLGDLVGGVDLSTVEVTLNSTTTTGTITLLENGADQTGGDVNVTGDQSSYRFTYTPPFLWDYNDKVLVVISGTDLIPTVDGNPFFCDDPEPNTFVGDIPFNILNEEDLTASLTVIGDVSPPYISDASPASGTIGNNVFSPVSVSIADDLTGVDLSTISVTVDGKTIINNGTTVTEEASVTGSTSEYTITYNPSSAFDYGSTTTVVVAAKDRVETGPPNELNTSYSFSFIEDTTLIIENFKPEVGTHHQLDKLDIEVDIRDDSYGVDSSQSFLVVNNSIVSGTVTAITSGINISYHPPNDFAFDEPIRVTVHGTNNNTSAPVVKEAFFDLFFGCRIFYFNEKPYVHADNVDVFVRARNLERLFKDLSTGYFFSTYTQPKEDLSASIEAVNPQVDLPATLSGLGPEHRYGETVTVEFSVEDLEGRLFGPYIYTYTIEEKS